MPVAVQHAMPEETFATPAAAEVVHAAAAEMAAPVAAPESAFVREPLAAAPAIHREPAPMPVRSEPARMPVPDVEVEKALEQSGLVLVQTDPSKVKLAQPAPAPQYVPAQPRPRRAPPPDTGPLQIVETRKDA